jgi:hypothetical protein
VEGSTDPPIMGFESMVKDWKKKQKVAFSIIDSSAKKVSVNVRVYANDLLNSIATRKHKLTTNFKSVPEVHTSISFRCRE